MNKFHMRPRPRMHILQSDHGVREPDMTVVQLSSLNKLSEENQHMLRFIHYLNGAGAEAIVPAIDKPQNNFESLKSAFEFGLQGEQTVSKSIYELVDMAGKEKDYSTYSFLQWFVTEQIEEETLFQTILQKFDLLGGDKLAIYQIDQSLSSIRSQIVSKQANQG